MTFAFITKAKGKSIGSAKRTLKMAPHLVSNGADVYIIINSTDENRRRIGQLEGVTGIYIESESYLEEYININKVLNEIRPDIVYTNGISLTSVFFAGRHVRIVEHAELYSKNEDKNITERIKHKVYEWVSIFAADAIIAASKHLKRKYEKRLNNVGIRKNVSHIPYGYEKGYISNRHNEHQLESKESQKIVYFGSISRDFGFKDIIDAVHYIQEKRSFNIELVFVGSGKKVSELDKYCQEKLHSTNVLFTGFVKEEEVPVYVEGADVLVSPLEDTFRDKYRCPSKIPMYMASGNPIVTCKIGEVPRYLGEEGFYYEPGNVMSLVRSLEKALSVDNVVYKSSSLVKYRWESLSGKFYDLCKELAKSVKDIT